MPPPKTSSSMLNLEQPENFMPIHGETRHLRRTPGTSATGMPEENIFVLDNGDCLEIDEEGAHPPSA